MTAPAPTGAPLPPPASLRLRARGPLDLVDDGYAALRAHPGLLLGTGALFLVPLVALVALIGEGSPTPGLVTDGSWPAGIVSALGFSLAPALMGLPLARAVALQAAGAPITWRAAYGLGARQWFAAVGAWTMLVPVRLLAALLFVLPYLGVTVAMVPLAAVIALEGGGPLRSLRRTTRVGLRSFGRGLGVVAAQQLVGWFIGLLLAIIPAAVVLAAPDRWQRPLANLGQLALGLLVCPPAAWTAAAFYLDDRIRRDGLDLSTALDEWESRRDAPAQRAPAAPAGAAPAAQLAERRGA